MDYIKYVLIAGLAAVSYLLLLAWQEDYPPVSSQTETQMENTAALPSDLPIESSGSDLPTAPANNAATSSDIPSVGSATAMANEESNTDASERLYRLTYSIYRLIHWVEISSSLPCQNTPRRWKHLKFHSSC